MLKQITRTEFCKKARVSEHDPMISYFLNGKYLMPAFGFAFYENEDCHSNKYYVRNVVTKEMWRISFSRIDDKCAGIVHHWEPDDSNRFGGHWKFHKVWH